MTCCCPKVGPKILGVVQAIIGAIILIFGFVNKNNGSVSDFSGVTYWGSISFICSGILSAVAEGCSHDCLKKVSMVMNLFSTGGGIAATGLFSADLYKPLNELKNIQNNFYKSSGSCLVFSLLEVFMSIWTFLRICNPCK